MKLSKESRKLAKQLYQASFSNGRLDDAKVRGLVQSIIGSKPRHYIAVIKQYQRFVRAEVQRRSAVIESAQPLYPETSSRITDDLKKRYGNDLTTEFKVVPDLIGGLRIRIGSDVWDGSLQGRLGRLERELTAA